MKPYLKHIIKILVVTVFTITLARVLVFIPLNFTIFSSANIQKIDQFDIYSDLMQKSGVKPFDNNIIVVTVPQNAGRMELAEALNMLAECNPAAVAVDIYLKGEADDFIDDMLVDAIKSNDVVVFPAIYDKHKEINDSSLLEIKNCKVHKGYVSMENISTAYRHSFDKYRMVGNDTVYSLGLEALRLTYPEKIEKLKERHGKKELINFMMDIPSISYEDIPYMSDMITGRIVILGVNVNTNYNNASNYRLSDIMVHAYSVSTVFHECYIDRPANWLLQLCSIIIILLFIHCNIIFATKFSHVGGFFIRLLTYSLFFAMAIGSYLLFVKESLYIDCGQLLIAIAFAPWAQDIYKLLDVACTRTIKICKYIINKKNKL